MSDLIDDISALLGLPRANCEGIARTAPNRYKVFYIPKRNGRDLRLVAQPAREVKAIQRLIIQLIENKLPIHDAATAYRSGGSIFKMQSLTQLQDLLLNSTVRIFFHA